MPTQYRNVHAHDTCYISPAAGIVGSVTLGERCSVFAGAQLRGDCGVSIEVGSCTNIQENAVLHVSPGSGCVLGNNVTVGHGAILHGCTVDDGALIGMGAVVLDGAHIQSGSLVAAGALVTGGKTFPENSLIMGSPAKAVRTLSPEEVETKVVANARAYVEVAEEMLAQGLMRHPEAGFCGQVGAEG